ncbi:MAG: prealbumin-like fold domain-containing protein [Clostridium sp.]|uniref:prealbumin-like fold domain-containing protein n=1 Tax=Clostridium sp. TaxID=1506 RepID=UPI003F3F57BD
MGIEKRREKESNILTHKPKGKTKGKITVYTLMNSLNGEVFSGAKLNLYRINGVSPSLEATIFSDKDGKAEFKNIENGNYRIIEIIDKSIYEKPSYIKWNEVNISNYSKEETIYVINRKKENIIN